MIGKPLKRRTWLPGVFENENEPCVQSACCEALAHSWRVFDCMCEKIVKKPGRAICAAARFLNVQQAGNRERLLVRADKGKAAHCGIPLGYNSPTTSRKAALTQ